MTPKPKNPCIKCIVWNHNVEWALFLFTLFMSHTHKKNHLNPSPFMSFLSCHNTDMSSLKGYTFLFANLNVSICKDSNFYLLSQTFLFGKIVTYFYLPIQTFLHSQTFLFPNLDIFIYQDTYINIFICCLTFIIFKLDIFICTL